MGRTRHKTTQAERDLSRALHEYNRNETNLRTVYAHADDVLDERGEAATPTARAQVINEFERVGR